MTFTNLIAIICALYLSVQTVTWTIIVWTAWRHRHENVVTDTNASMLLAIIYTKRRARNAGKWGYEITFAIVLTAIPVILYAINPVIGIWTVGTMIYNWITSLYFQKKYPHRVVVKKA